ncbi:MAG: hypothetical protein AB8G05_07820 [Oligoflexales bacterium]
MRLNWIKNKEKEKGSALVMAMFIVTGILTLVGLSSLSEDNTRSILKKNSMQTSRDELAKTLISFITNPQIIKLQADNKNYSDGHALLHNCLNGDDLRGQTCRRTENITTDADGYYNLTQLPLKAPKDFQYPSEKTDRPPNGGQAKNCPDDNPESSHPSCLISGESSKKVGYNLRGETGALSPCFPFEAVVYVNPYCSDDASTCTRAEDLEFFYQLIHRRFNQECALDTGKTDFRLGTFPKKPESISLPRHTLVDYECNVGAFIAGYESDGSINCECRFPYSPIPGRSNEKGVLCHNVSQNCPAGSVLVARNEQGNPVCRVLSKLNSARLPSLPLTAATHGAVDDDNNLKRVLTCPNSGWLQEVDLSCTGAATTERIPGEGTSCLFLYSFVKMIDDGKSRIKGYVPTRFYREGKTLPCLATKESFFRGAIDSRNPGWNALCGTAIGASLFLGNFGPRATRIVSGVVGMADLVFGETTGEVKTQGHILDGILIGISIGIQATKAIPFVGWAIALAAAAGAGVGFLRWQVRVDYDCFPINTKDRDVTCELFGKCYFYDGDYTK